MKVNARAAARLEAGHVWVYASDILDTGNAQPGTTVDVFDPRHRPLGVADYSSTSQIALRLLARPGEHFDLAARLDAAIEHRRRVVRDSDAFRVVFSEADLLPGLIVDQYGSHLTVQCLTQAMAAREADVLAHLEARLKPAGIVLRNDAPVRAKEALPSLVETRGDVPPEVTVTMNGLHFLAALRSGQKTGLFLDQRENYAAAARHAHGAALDCFTSTGGFALHLARVCDRVEAIDSSGPAIERARANAAANSITNAAFHQADIFDQLTAWKAQRHRLDTIVLDPPAFTKSKAAIDKAIAGYKEINLRALRMLDRGGILVTCSCSQHVSEADFFEMLAAAALDAGRTLRIRERRLQGQDHPVLLTVPETLYLKCVIAEVL